MANALISNINIEQAARSVTGFAVFRGCNYYFCHVHRKPRCSLCLLPRKGTGGMPAPGPSERVFAQQPPMAAPALCSTSEPLNLVLSEPRSRSHPSPCLCKAEPQCAGGMWRDPHGQEPQGATSLATHRVGKHRGGSATSLGPPEHPAAPCANTSEFGDPWGNECSEYRWVSSTSFKGICSDLWLPSALSPCWIIHRKIFLQRQRTEAVLCVRALASRLKSWGWAVCFHAGLTAADRGCRPTAKPRGVPQLEAIIAGGMGRIQLSPAPNTPAPLPDITDET